MLAPEDGAENLRRIGVIDVIDVMKLPSAGGWGCGKYKQQQQQIKSLSRMQMFSKGGMKPPIDKQIKRDLQEEQGLKIDEHR